MRGEDRGWVQVVFLTNLLLFVESFPISAALISYDGAAYEATNSLNGLNGGTGWTNAWNGPNDVLTGGLNYPGLLAQSNRFAVDANLATTRASFRTPDTNGFDHLLRSDRRWGRAGTEVWVSLLMRRETSDIATYAGLSLFNLSVEQLFIGTPNNEEHWGVHLPVLGGGTTVSSRRIVRNETVLLVARLTFPISGPTNRVDLFVNPKPGVVPTTPDATRTVNTPIAFTQLRLEGGSPGTASFDEIRFGETYADVTPVVSEFAVVWSAPGTNVVTRSFTNHLLLAESSGDVSNFTVSVTAENATLFPPENIQMSGLGHERAVAFHPVPGQIGQSLITATVSNANGQTLTRTFTLEVQPGGVRHFETIQNTDLKAFGLGLLRDRGGGTLAVTGVVGTVTRALLYWNGPENSLDPTNNAHVRFNGVDIMGANVGLSSDNCWLYNHSHSYRADITSLVTTNGNYRLTNFWKSGSAPVPANVNGVSVLVFYDDSDPSNNRDVTIFEGNDSNHPNAYEPGNWRAQLDGIHYGGGPAQLTMHVSDGQPGSGSASDGNLTINGAPFLSGQIFQGATVPRAAIGVGATLWDIRTEDISSFLTPGTNNLLLALPWNGQDCISLVVATVSVPSVGAPLEANLMLMATSTQSTVCVGLPVVQSFAVTNAGPGDAANVRLNYALPASVTLVTQRVSQGSCSVSNGIVLCQLGNVAASANVTLELTLLFGGEGTNSIQPSVQSDTPDPAPTDNSITLQIVASPPPALLIERVSPGVQLSWPALPAFDPFTLEQATNLTSPIFWAPVEATRQTEQDRYRVDLPTTDARFFRLRKP